MTVLRWIYLATAFAVATGLAVLFFGWIILAGAVLVLYLVDVGGRAL